MNEPKFVKVLSVRITDRDEETLTLLGVKYPNKTQSEIVRELIEESRRGMDNTETKTDVMFAVLCLVGGEDEEPEELKARAKDLRKLWKDKGDVNHVS